MAEPEYTDGPDVGSSRERIPPEQWQAFVAAMRAIRGDDPTAGPRELELIFVGPCEPCEVCGRLVVATRSAPDWVTAVEEIHSIWQRKDREMREDITTATVFAAPHHCPGRLEARLIQAAERRTSVAATDDRTARATASL